MPRSLTETERARSVRSNEFVIYCDCERANETERSVSKNNYPARPRLRFFPDLADVCMLLGRVL